MSVLSKLTFANLKENKRRTIFTVLGVTLATALMFAVVGMAASLAQTLINADPGRYESGLSIEATRELIAVAVIIVTIIAVTSIFTIKNSFSISAGERMKQFGMLRSVGATKPQIRGSVILEGLIVWTIGVPIGILIGILATLALSQIVTFLIGDGLEVPVAFSLPIWIFPAVALLSLETVFLSALIPAIKAAKISPVEAIRGTKEVNINPRKIRTSRLTQKFFGIGGTIASKNLKRSRKKYRTTVVSIVLSVATFIGLSTFMDQAFGSIKLFYSQAGYDVMASAASERDFIEVADKLDYDELAYYKIAAVSSGIEDGLDVLIVNNDYFKKYAEGLGVKTEDYSKIAILDDYVFVADGSGKKVLRHVFDYEPGAEIELSIYDESGFSTRAETLEITHITDRAPLGYEFSTVPMVLVSENYAAEHHSSDTGSSMLFVKTREPEKIVEFLEGKDEVYAQNVREAMKLANNLYLLVAIFLYGFIAVISLIGVTNILNTISANMALRASDFASLKSVGMTRREFNNMIRLESLMYSAKALAIGIPAGILISFGFYKAMSTTYDFGYSLPFEAIGIAIVAVALLISAIMRYSVRLVNRQNIIETIRSDTV